MSGDDWFLVLNPDVLVEHLSLLELVKRATENCNELATINLYKDSEYKVYDNCIRTFPTLIDFASSYIGLGNKTIISTGSAKVCKSLFLPSRTKNLVPIPVP